MVCDCFIPSHSYQLQEHRRANHSGETALQCHKCDRTFPHYRGLYNHARLVHLKGQFGCCADGCNFVDHTTKAMYYHHQRHIHRPPKQEEATLQRERDPAQAFPDDDDDDPPPVSAAPTTLGCDGRKRIRSVPQECLESSKVYKIISLNCLVEGCEQTFATIAELDEHAYKSHHILHFRCLVPKCGRSFLTS